MPQLIATPTRVLAAGNKPKSIDEFVGRVNSGTTELSIAHMRSPAGWEEPGQTPEFDEYTVVLRGMLRVNPPGRDARRAGRAGGDRARRGVGPLLVPGAGGRGVPGRLPTGVLARYGASRRRPGAG